MLYERWREVVRDLGQETALWDLPGGRRWTFDQLATEVERGTPKRPDPFVCPTGVGPDFVRDVLLGWRHRSVVCPLEGGQQPPFCTSLPEGVVHLKTTSGTTGAARFVAFRAEQLMTDVENIRATMGLRAAWPNLAAISLAHSYGFSNLVLPLLLQGVPLVLCGSGLPEAVRRAAAVVPHVTLPGVPALWRSWLEADAVPINIRLAISAGAPLPLALESAIFNRYRTKVHNFYGATECGGIAYDRTETPRAEAALAGRALDGVTLTIGSEGRLEVHSRAVGSTYWPEPDDVLSMGVYRTQDLAELRDGDVILRGRAGDLIHVAGRKVAPEIIEQVLQRCPGVRQCVVLGLPTDESVRMEAIAVVFAADPTTSREDLQAHAHRSLPDWQVPKVWHRVESIEANDRGKLSRKHWRDKLAKGRE